MLSFATLPSKISVLTPFSLLWSLILSLGLVLVLLVVVVIGDHILLHIRVTVVLTFLEAVLILTFGTILAHLHLHLLLHFQLLLVVSCALVLARCSHLVGVDLNQQCYSPGE